MTSRLTLALPLALVGAACTAGDAQPMSTTGAPPGPTVQGAWPAPDGPCQLGPIAPTRLLLTTTDYSTGALTLVVPAAMEVIPDIAVGSTDAIPFVDPYTNRVVVVHRFGHDYLEVLTDPGFSPRGQFPVQGEGAANPQSMAFLADGDAWVTTLGSRWLRRFDFTQPGGEAEVDRVDLAAFADADGNPEAGVVIACGSQTYVAVQRLDPSFSPVDVDMLVPLDLDTDLPVDLDADTPGGQGQPLLGTWLRQLRLDPTDPEGRTLLALTSGIERIDTRTGEVQWAVPHSVFADAGIDGFRLPQSFAVSADGQRAYLAAYRADFSEVQLFTVGLDGHAPQTPIVFADGMDSVERSLELVGDQLWYGSTRTDAPGLWVFDVSNAVPTVVAGPLPTGLPPYSMVALP